NFATGVGHSAGNLAQPNDGICTTCHNAVAIKGYHMQVNKTPNNPETPAGLVNFTYEINSATVNATTNDLTVKFKILGDGTPVTLAVPAAGLTLALPGFTGSPSFLLAYAQSGAKQTMTTFTDYNNLGKNAAQPATVSIANLLDTNRSLTSGTITGPDAGGFYTANIVSAVAFPVGAKLRAVALQGYFTQVAPAAARHTVSVIKPVSGDAVRRTIVDPAKCGKCHEWFEGHGGNRVYETQVCVTCHVPNLSTSGRGIADAALVAYAFTPGETAILTSWGFDKTLVNAALAFPEFSNNFKDMIHGIHAGKERTNPVRFVRDRSSVFVVFDTSKITFPNLLKNCESCHVTTPAGINRQTYKADLPTGVLPSTAVTTNGAIVTTADVNTSRSGANLPNATDMVTAPVAAACVSCHDSAVAVAHMNSNGGNISTSRAAGVGNIQGISLRSSVAIEQCALCHGEGKVADVVKAHAK
ncbi:MAG: cytochrome C, partial [Verrucomicrobia bacterium]|nr:cytochrome C [Deltaproteobacteria bacterium]